MLEHPCIPCQHGEHDRCMGGQDPPPGMLGGWRCSCKGDCKARSDTIGPLLVERLAWERENPRPEPLVRVERAIVRALRDVGFGTQHQVTREDGFDIATDDIIVRVELNQ